MPDAMAGRRRRLTLPRLLTLLGAVIGIGAWLRAHPPVVTARGKPTTPASAQALDVRVRDHRHRVRAHVLSSSAQLPRQPYWWSASSSP